MTVSVRRNVLAPMLGIALMACALLLSCGCGRKSPETDEQSSKAKVGITRVAILVDDSASPMRTYQLSLLERLIRARPHMEVSTVHAGGDAEVQIRQVREAMQTRVGYIMVFPQDAGKLAQVLRESTAGGAHVFVFSADVPEDASSCAIYTDERRLGEIAGEYVVSALKTKAQTEAQPAPKGRVVMLRGEEDSVVCEQRAEGYLTALRPHPGIVLVHDAPGDWSEKSAGDRIREALRIQKQFDVIYAQSDLMAAGASKAVRASSAAARDAMLIIGTDGVPGKGSGVSLVVSGEVDATVYHPPLVDVAWREMQLLLDKPEAVIRKRIHVKPFMITPENAARIQREGVPVPEID
jgi:ABC-type sugar transport system substrate-binding protein